jgi:hypothetical protein
MRTNTVLGFERFLEKWPSSEHGDQARQRKDALIDAARKAEEAERERVRLAQIAENERRDREAEAERTRRAVERKAQEEKAFNAARARGEIDGYTEFLARYPGSSFAPQIRELLDQRRAMDASAARLERMKQIGRDRSEAINVDTCEGYLNFLVRWGAGPEGEWARNRLAVLRAEDALRTMLEMGVNASQSSVNGPTLVAITKIANRFKQDDDEWHWYRGHIDSMQQIMRRRVFPGRLLPGFWRWLIAPAPPAEVGPSYSSLNKIPTKPAKQGLQLRFFVFIAALVVLFWPSIAQDGLLLGGFAFAASSTFIALCVIVLDLVSELIESQRRKPFLRGELPRSILQEYLEYRRFMKERSD